ncbi:globin [Sulfurovum sp. TSL1]|uniref:globin domain-containing protein n=1 Tax=Sulfurovum sp. TSL1 TaxID=2826994 RepID=UPI001CC62CEE|nr:globin [Sulfurovum sp. TSL1]GIT98794.1 globin [Sulfurovum sp. TSL1]
MNFSSSSLDFSILPYQEGVNPPVTKPNPEFLTDIGEEGMRALLDRFYMGLFESPIKDLFPDDKEEMKKAAQHSADFFIQICGGPTYFNQNRGAPQMRGRHAPFAITPNARLHWLVTFEEALQPIIEQKLSSEENIQSFWNYINVFSMWMINTRD